jgi:hypothetical protein
VAPLACLLAGLPACSLPYFLVWGGSCSLGLLTAPDDATRLNHTHVHTQAARQKRGEVIKRAENYVKEYKKVRSSLHQNGRHQN